MMCYILMGSVISSVISCLGEMTALMPVNAPVMEFPRRFLDRGVGFAVGWMYWFAYAVIAAEEITAVSNTIDFRYDDGRTSLGWPVGQNIDPAVWITLFLALVIIINLFPVKVKYSRSKCLTFVNVKFALVLWRARILVRLFQNYLHNDAYLDDGGH